MKYKFEDIAEFNPKENIKKGTLAKKIAMEKLQPFCRDIPTYEITEFKGGTKFKNGDTIMARITPCLENGKTAKVNILENNEIGFGSTEYIVFRAKPNILDEDFLYYLVCSSFVREPAIKSMVGSSGRQRVQIDVIKKLELDLPLYEEQIKIGSVLKSIDDKIELNNKINKNLEQQAQAIFIKEFLCFDVIPDTWKESSLINIANYLNGLAMQKFRPNENKNSLPVLKIRELRQGFCDNSSDLCSANIQPKYIIKNGDVIFSWSGSLLIDFWCGEICGLNQHLFKVTSNTYDKWFYYLWTKHHIEQFTIIAMDKATTMGHIKRNDIEKAKVIIPPKEDYLRIGAILQPIYDIIIQNRLENNKLSLLKDTLLPKLMSGEIDASKINV